MLLTVTDLANLASVKLSEKQEKELETSITSVLNFMDEVKNLDVDNVTETSRVTEEENVFREDVATPSLPQETALQNAKTVNNGFFQVKGILDSE